MAENESLGIRMARTVGAFLLNFLALVIIAGSLKFAVQSLLGPVTKNLPAIQLFLEWVLNIGCGVLTGFFVRKRWKTETAKWIWIMPAPLFVFGVLLSISHRHGYSVLIDTPSPWAPISGTGCYGVRNLQDCKEYALFTVLFVRAAAYSLAAYVSGRVIQSPVQQEEVIRPVAFL
jgi:hypothetical protein